MGRPTGNGVIEMVDERESGGGFFCMKLLEFLGKEAEIGTPEYADLWDVRFTQAKNHQCFYKDKCQVFARTKAKLGKTPIQLQLEFK